MISKALGGKMCTRRIAWSQRRAQKPGAALSPLPFVLNLALKSRLKVYWTGGATAPPPLSPRNKKTPNAALCLSHGSSGFWGLPSSSPVWLVGEKGLNSASVFCCKDGE